MRAGLILLLLVLGVVASACSRSDLVVVEQAVFTIPDGYVLDCTVLNKSDELKAVAISGALLTGRKATVDVKYLTGEIGPGERKTFVLEFETVPFEGFLCRVQELFTRFL